MDSLKTAADLVALLKEKKATVGSIESMTGGLIAATITSVSGASEVFKGSIVSYSPDVKINIVGVKEETIAKYGVVSYEVASEMANYGRKLLDVDYCVSITGNAGPTQEEDNKGVGTVFVSLVSKNYVWGLPLALKGDRQTIREDATRVVIDFIYKAVESIK